LADKVQSLQLEHPNGSTGTVLHGGMLNAAIEIARNDPSFGTPQRWELIAASLMVPRFNRAPDDLRDAFMAAVEAEPKIVLEAVHRALLNSRQSVGGESLLDVAIPYYARHYQPAEAALQRIEKYEAGRTGGPTIPVGRNRRSPIVDEAAATLVERIEASNQ
jgi:hypothetical protein